MDHNLGDSLNLESAMGVDFEHSDDTVVNQGDIALEPTGHEETMQMEFDHIEEQPILMDTRNEELIDFMGSQFTLHELSVEGDNQMTGPEVTVEANESQNLENPLTSHSDTMLDLQYDQLPITIPAATGDVLSNYGPRIVSVESAAPEAVVIRPNAPSNKAVRTETRLAPRQVAIAPKPPRTITKVVPKFVSGKQFAQIAPKPLGIVKKGSLTSAIQANSKGNTVIAKIGKQFVMMPPEGAPQKIKLVPASAASAGMQTVRLVSSVGDAVQAQLFRNQNASTAKHAKIIIQGQSSADGAQAPAVISRVAAPGGARFVTLDKNQKVPISMINNMIIQSPSKQSVKGPQMVGIKSPARLLRAPASTQGTTATTKKIVITGPGGQNLVLNSAAAPKTTQIMKTVNAGQKTQLHPVNIPGKGIQYIRLVTNPTSTAMKAATAIKTSPKALTTAKTFMLTDSKGNLIQMTAEKMVSGQPPPLLVTGNANSINKLTAKPQQRLVRIAPITSKPAQVAMQKESLRSGQSLLVPISAETTQPSEPSRDDVTQPHPPDNKPQLLEEQSQADDMPHLLNQDEQTVPFLEMKTELLQNEAEETVHTEGMEEYREDSREEEAITPQPDEPEVDSKTALHALIADAVSSPTAPTRNLAPMPLLSVQSGSPGDFPVTSVQSAPARPHPEIHVSFERQQSQEEHPLIVIPSFLRSEPARGDDAQEPQRLFSVEVDPYNTYHPSESPPPDSELTNEFGLRPRKPCNCTKSQCLKLYCDCFANGEFCNSCNCNNCHNNLQNEELRQKAIRGCLDRNPNAFRPKIGKSRNAGPDLVRRHNKGCNCKRSGCLKNYCECYEAKIACSAMCKCVGCRNVEDSISRARRRSPPRRVLPTHPPPQEKQPCSFMTSEVIEAVCQCLVAAAAEGNTEPADPLRDVIHEFARCLQDIISASNHTVIDESVNANAKATVHLHEVIEAVCQCLVAAAAEGNTEPADPLRNVIHEFARCLQGTISASNYTVIDEP